MSQLEGLYILATKDEIEEIESIVLSEAGPETLDSTIVADLRFFALIKAEVLALTSASRRQLLPPDFDARASLNRRGGRAGGQS